MPLPLSKDDVVEIIATFVGSFILGASFAKELFIRGNFELRIFFFGLSSIFLFLIVSMVAGIKIKFINLEKKAISLSWIVLFSLGSFSAYRLFNDQFDIQKLSSDIRHEALFFILCYTLSSDVLYLLNKDELDSCLRKKTPLKYLLAPINGMGCGTIMSWILMWFTMQKVS